MTEEQWSPAQIVGYLRRQGEKSVCVETVYTHIRKDKANGGELWKLAVTASNTSNARYQRPTKPFPTVR